MQNASCLLNLKIIEMHVNKIKSLKNGPMSIETDN